MTIGTRTGTRYAILPLLLMAAGAWSTNAWGQLRVPQQTVAPGPSQRFTTESVKTELAGDHAKAISLADEAIKADAKDPWGYYDRGDALGSLRQVDQAVASFREAEQRFSADDIWGQSIAIWGQANALRQVGKCQDAAPIYERYAALVEKVDSEAAAMARQFAKACKP